VYLLTAVVLLVVLAAALCHGNTLVVAEHESIVTDAAFTAGCGNVAALRGGQPVAGLRARLRTRLIVTVGAAGEC